ncbi:hypothetical protein [Streptomyces sp. NPDC090022]|uniref:hypothetical protein n=1 Tax=Streptomyces sp. NPDC090022 TaxID=3365920 RepID=UPI0038208919
MSADDLSPDSVWPLPPAWMFACGECHRLYERMKDIQALTAELWLTGERGVDWDPFDMGPGSQIRLARHLAEVHTDLLPGWTRGCEHCAHRRSLLARDPGSAGARLVSAQHRAGHLFLPPRTLGLV